MKTDTKKLVAWSLIGVGAYSVFRSVVPDAAERGEGSIGGSDDMYGEDFLDKQGFTALGIDPNTTPEQPYQEPSFASINPDPVDVPSGSSSPSFPSPTPTPESLSSNAPLEWSPFSLASTPPTLDNSTAEQPISAPEAALGALGLIPSAASSLGKLTAQGASIKPVAIIGDAVSEVPYKGNQLKKFVTSSDTTIKAASSEIVESGAKATLKATAKKGAKAAVGAIPFIGIAAGSEFDVMVDDRPRWLAYPTNILGDVVGGFLGVVTAAASPFVQIPAVVAGQVGTESAIYGVYDTLTGKNHPDVAALNAQLMNDGTVVPDYAIPKNIATSFNMENAGKSKVDTKRFVQSGSGYADTELLQSVTTDVAISRSSTRSSSQITYTPVTKIDRPINSQGSAPSSSSQLYSSHQNMSVYVPSKKSSSSSSSSSKKSSSSSSRSSSSRSSSSKNTSSTPRVGKSAGTYKTSTGQTYKVSKVTYKKGHRLYKGD